MFNLLAHAGHSHDAEILGQSTAIDHCAPIVIGASIIVALLVATIIYLLLTWQPKSFTAKKVSSTTTKKTSKK